MSRLALDVATYINTISSGKVYAKFKAYANFAPDNSTESISVIDTGGYSPDRRHGNAEPIDRQTVQIIVRSTQPSSAYLVATAIYRDLDGLYGVQMNSNTYLSLEAVNPPLYMGMVDVSTEGQAHQYTLNMYGQTMRT